MIYGDFIRIQMGLVEISWEYCGDISRDKHLL